MLRILDWNGMGGGETGRECGSGGQEFFHLYTAGGGDHPASMIASGLAVRSDSRKAIIMSLTMKVVENKPRIFVVSLAGKLDGNTFADLEKKIDYLLKDGGAKVLTLDLAALEFISSMGIRVIFKAKKDLARIGGSLFLARIPAPIVKVLEIIDALPSMQIFSSIQEMDAYLAKMQGL